MSVNKKTNQEIKSEISRLQSTMAKRGQQQKAKKSRKKVSNQSSLGPRVNAPSASTRSNKVGVASVRQIKDGCNVCNREFVMNIQVPNAPGWINIDRLRCNPGSAKTFPWLSGMATSWESYRFRKLRFQFIARCPTTTAGSLILSPDYDAQDGQPATEQQMTQLRDTVEDNPWKDMTCDLKPASLNRAYKTHFVMDDSRYSTTSQDEKTIDAAQFFISADKDANANWGKLWVDYDVDFFTPQTMSVTVPETGGARVNVNGGVPTTTGGMFTNTLAGIALAQSASDPIVKALDNSVTGNTTVVEFLRDWSGTVQQVFNAAAGANNFNVTAPQLYLRSKATGASNVQGSSALEQDSAMPISTSFTSQLGSSRVIANQMFNVIAKAGDQLGIKPTGLDSLTGAITSPTYRLFLGGANAAAF